MKINFQYRWYEIRRGQAYHYLDINLKSCLTNMNNFAKRHNWYFRYIITSPTSVIIHRVR